MKLEYNLLYLNNNFQFEKPYNLEILLFVQLTLHLLLYKFDLILLLFQFPYSIYHHVYAQQSHHLEIKLLNFYSYTNTQYTPVDEAELFALKLVLA